MLYINIFIGCVGKVKISHKIRLVSNGVNI